MESCIAGSRALIHRRVLDEFTERLLDLARTAKMGDPLEDATQVGPMVSREQFEQVLVLTALRAA